MSQALTSLLDLLQLTPLNSLIFRGNSQDLGLKQVFGGQVIGQSLAAAKQTVSPDRFVHSCHSYFLRPGDSHQPIIYEVENLRDGNSFSSRRVSAIQNGVPIFFMTASFQAAEAGFDHQSNMPDVPMPETLMSESDIAKKMAPMLPEPIRNLFCAERPIEMRPVQFHNPFKGEVVPAVRHIWMRSNGQLPDDLRVHQYLLGYASDFNFLPTALQPHGMGFLESGIQIATIDHSIWFHRPFKMDDWLLYAIESPSAYGSRGYVKGQIFTREGLLVASTAQEGVIRYHEPAKLI